MLEKLGGKKLIFMQWLFQDNKEDLQKLLYDLLGYPCSILIEINKLPVLLP
jgi:hypothetical protein